MPFAGYIPDKAIRHTPEFARVAALPRRVWTDESAQRLAEIFTPLLAKPGGTQKLFPVQAQALNDAGTQRGLFASIRVGGGKTLISLLCVHVMQLQRPLLIIPAAIRQKTKCEMVQEYGPQWRIPVERIRIVSYEELGRDAQSRLIENWGPDGIICDEVHRLKNPKAAVTKRVMRYMNDHPSTLFAGMSGTITKRSLKDYAHILKWVFKNAPPIPRGWAELEEWCAALDEKTNPMALHLHPGAFLGLATPEDQGYDLDGLPCETSTARKTWRRRLGETAGVVATTEGHTGCSLYVGHVMHPRNGSNESAIEGAFALLRSDDPETGSRTPDGWVLPDGMARWAVARQLALGFYYRWNPRPPEPWMILRQTWAKQVREWIKYHPRDLVLDSEFQVAKAVGDGKLPDYDGVYAKWLEMKPTFEPNKEAVWLDDGALKLCAEWLEKHPKGICWVEHTAFGDALEKLSGLPFFRQGGLDKNRLYIEDATGPIIASVKANGTGKNLQKKWCDNFFASWEPNALQAEQTIGRTHRELQPEDEVNVSILVGCIEHADAIERSLADARYTEDSTGQAQKLLYADLTVPNPLAIVSIPSRRYQRQ